MRSASTACNFLKLMEITNSLLRKKMCYQFTFFPDIMFSISFDRLENTHKDIKFPSHLEFDWLGKRISRGLDNTLLFFG